VREEEIWKIYLNTLWTTLKREETKLILIVKATVIPIINLTIKMKIKIPIPSIISVRKMKVI
jgi:hypothetical protein